MCNISWTPSKSNQKSNAGIVESWKFKDSDDCECSEDSEGSKDSESSDD